MAYKRRCRHCDLKTCARPKRDHSAQELAEGYQRLITGSDRPPINVIKCSLSNLSGKNEWCGRAARVMALLDNGNDVQLCPAHLAEMRNRIRGTVVPITPKLRQLMLDAINEESKNSA